LKSAPAFAPYFDVTFLDPGLPWTAAQSGQLDYTLAFVLSGAGGACAPSWGSQFDLSDPAILNPIKQVIAQGGQMILATGGALGNYLEHNCPTVEALAGKKLV
jgi:chitinase